ncbi:MAG TPA: uL15m family ribosomal protein, partial [Candidatus Bathyarchaeia archaeon]|nr:uL15m family ribosomal protein [Candidatus Bathyarchaeia archaeon]
EEGRAKQSGSKFEINLGDMGFTKLLGNGRIRHPVRVVVAECSEKAANKISQAGGEVVLPSATDPAEKG